MYKHCFDGLVRIRENAMTQAGYTGMMHMGESFSPVADLQAHRALPTLYYINAVAILDDALEIFMRAHFSEAECEKRDTLGKRVKFLGARGVTSDPDRLDELRRKRNKFSHEVGEYGTWEELWPVLDAVKAEIQRLESVVPKP